MNTAKSAPPTPPVLYPETDGKPMSDNTVQFRWIVKLQGGIDLQFHHDPNVFVAGDLLWYPVQGNNKIRAAPDAMVVFGRPKGDRGSYLQWEEGGVAPQVVFEVRSPGNRFTELHEKFEFYQRYGVEEYYLYDPEHVVLDGWQRAGSQLVAIPDLEGWVSPRLRIRFDVSSGDLILYHPDNSPIRTYVELGLENQQLASQKERAEKDAREAREARQKADERAEKLAAKLRALGVDPDA
jgi:Uma2 family endonuclease